MESPRIGHGKMRQQVKSMVESVAVEKNLLHAWHISDGWWKKILERQPWLALQQGKVTACPLELYKERDNRLVLWPTGRNTGNNDLKDHPAQIYNMDQSGMPLDPHSSKCVTKRGQKKVRYHVSGKKEQITVLGCVNVIGQSISPMIIYDGKYLNHQWTVWELPVTYYGMSDKGWTEQELFRHWLKDHFISMQ